MTAGKTRFILHATFALCALSLSGLLQAQQQQSLQEFQKAQWAAREDRTIPFTVQAKDTARANFSTAPRCVYKPVMTDAEIDVCKQEAPKSGNRDQK